MTLSKYNEVMDNIKVTDEMRQRILLNIEKEMGSAGNSGNSLNNQTNISDFSSLKKKKDNNVVFFIKKYGSMVAIFALIVAGSYGVIRTVGLNGSKGEMAATSSQEMAAEDSIYEEEAVNSADLTEATEESAYDMDMAEGVFESASETAQDIPDVTESAEPALAAKDDKEKDSLKDDAASLSNAIGSPEGVLTSAKELSKELGFTIKDIDSLKDKAVSTEYCLHDAGGEIIYITSDDKISYCASSKGSFVGGRDVDITSFAKSTTIEAGDKRALAYGDGDVFKLAYWEEDGIWYSIISDKGMTEDEMTSIIKEN